METCHNYGENTIVFIGNNHLTNTFANGLAHKGYNVHTFSNAYWSSGDIAVRHHIMPIGFFGLLILNETILKNIEMALPVYYKGLIAQLRLIRPDVLLVQEFTVLRYLQCLWYRIWNPGCRLIVMSETKHVPRGFVSKVGFFVLIGVGWLFQRYLHSIQTLSHEGRTWFKSHYFKNVINVTPVPVDETVFTEKSSVASDKKLQILVNARITPYKNQMDILKALSLIKQSGNTDLKVTFIGHRKDLSFYNQLQRYIVDNNLQTLVTFLDTVPTETLVSIYHAHDLLILASHNEAMGMVVPEAMSCGLATITSDSVGANVYVKEGETGWVFKTGDIAQLADCVSEAVANREQVKVFGHNAAVRMRRLFSAKNLVDEYEKYIM